MFVYKLNYIFNTENIEKKRLVLLQRLNFEK